MSYKKIFSVPKLYIKGEWYVYYSFRDPITGKMKLFKIYKGLSNSVPRATRLKRGMNIVKELKERLENGFNPFEEIYSAPGIHSSLFDNENNWECCINDFLKFKRTEGLELDTIDAYISKKNKFVKFLKSKNWELHHVKLFTYEMALEFFTWLTENNCHAAKTLKEYKSFLSMAAKHLKRRKLIAENVFELLPMYRSKPKKPKLFSDKELKRLKEHLILHDEQLWTIAQFVFYCFFRPNKEVRLMRVGQIDFEKGILWARSDTAKNDKELPVVIPEHFLKYLKSKEYDKADKGFYMFTKEGIPGEEPVGKNYIQKHFAKAKKVLNIDTYFYALKHTGNKKLSDNNVNILELMKQNRHSNPNQTYEYLKSLEGDYCDNLNGKFFEI